MDEIVRELPWTGERYVPQLSGTIALEHLHRYAIASEFVKGKRALDIASGEGYGSEILSRTAASVVGVDIDPRSVAHAQRKYKKANLSFKEGSCTEIPLDDHSVDIVISFETIEHIADHEKMLSEIKRVLMPDGILIISSPEKHEYTEVPDHHNPFHVKELNENQFKELLEKYFQHFKMLGQRVIYGSGIFEANSTSSFGGTYDFSKLPGEVTKKEGVPKALYLIAICSDVPLSKIESSFCEQPLCESDFWKEWTRNLEGKNDQLIRKDIQLEEKNLQIEQKGIEITEKEKQLVEKSIQILKKDAEIQKKEEIIKKQQKVLVSQQDQITIINENKIAQGIRMLSKMRITRALSIRMMAFKIAKSGLFDKKWYLQQNPDVAISKMDPLFHYLNFGEKEGRKASEQFHGLLYQQEHPDVAQAKINSLYHYVKWGKKEGRDIKKFDNSNVKTVEISECLPVIQTNTDFCRDVTVSVIIPVYLGYQETKKCIESVIRNQDKYLKEIIVINDCSPDQEIQNYLKLLNEENKIKLITNKKNKGFVASVNIGIQISDSIDILLLNSDTEVPPNWLSRLVSHAYKSSNIATVTPYSNNATICSWLSIKGTEIPSELSLADIDTAFFNANKGRQITIPTAVGFCMYIRRDCLHEVGLLDEILFGKGYGEENDFCMRATERGWKHVLACDTFVFHQGERSFGKEPQKKTKAIQVLLHKYPEYNKIIYNHIQKNESIGTRIAATACLIKKLNKTKVLIITHSWGGGTQRNIDEIIENNLDDIIYIVLTKERGDAQLIVHIWGLKISVNFTYANEDQLVSLLCSFGIDRIHIHHWIGTGFNLKHIINQLSIPFDFTVHDYYSICPQVNLIRNVHDIYCGEPSFNECNSCIKGNPLHCKTNIEEWRENNSWIIKEAANVFCPSIDVMTRMSRYYKEGNYIVKPHDKFYLDNSFTYHRNIEKRKTFRVGLFGGISPLKGRDILASVAKKTHHKNYEFIVVGYCYPPFYQSHSMIQEVGRYNESQLRGLIKELNLDLAWFPAVWPETYSYTLSAAIEAGLPILATRLGAFIERLEKRPYSWLVELSTDPDVWISYLEYAKSQLSK